MNISRRIRASQNVDFSSPLLPKPLERALEDIERIFGGAFGIYTTKMDSFFKELASSGVLTHMAECALVNVRSRGAETAFLDLFNGQFLAEEIIIDNHPITGFQLYKKILAIFQISFWEDANLSNYALIHAVARDLRSDFETRDTVVATAFRPRSNRRIQGKTNQRAPWLTARSRALRMVPDLATSLQTAFTSIWVPGPERRSRTVPLSKIFVESALIEGIGNGSPLSSHGNAQLTQASSISFEWFNSSIRRAIVLGDPGGGKSTFGKEM